MTDTVRDNQERQRFELDAEGHVAFSNYRREGNILTVLHTEVPDAVPDRGLRSALARGLLDIARAQGLPIRPLCPFVAAYIARHPEYADLLA